MLPHAKANKLGKSYPQTFVRPNFLPQIPRNVPPPPAPPLEVRALTAAPPPLPRITAWKKSSLCPTLLGGGGGKNCELVPDNLESWSCTSSGKGSDSSRRVNWSCLAGSDGEGQLMPT